MRLFLDGPSGKLEAYLWTPKGGAAPRAAAIVCHPHPLGGGTMDNKVVFRVARGLQTAGLAALRFNFRGTGASEGVHDGKGLEEEDAVAALDHLERRFPALPLWAAGFSFGSRTVGSLARREPRIERVALIALPTKAYDCTFVRELRQDVYVLLAENDEYGTPADFDSLGPLGPNFEVERIDGVDHFFREPSGREKTLEVQERVRAWAERQLQRAKR